MAEILIRAADNTSGHPMAWKRGMPVVVMPDGHPWGTKEILPPAQGGPFVIVRITDVTVGQIETFLQNRWGLSLCDEDRVSDVDIRRRHVHLRVDDLPANVRNQLRNTGSYTTTWTAIRTFLQNLRTLENA